MIKHKWLIQTVRTLFDIKMQIDSAAAINGAKLSFSERENIKKKLQDILDYIKDRIPDE